MKINICATKRIIAWICKQVVVGGAKIIGSTIICGVILLPVAYFLDWVERNEMLDLLSDVVVAIMIGGVIVLAMVAITDEVKTQYRKFEIECELYDDTRESE